MDKKLYIQPQTEITKAVLIQMLAGSINTNIEDGPGYGGKANGQEPEVKGEAWTDIWDN